MKYDLRDFFLREKDTYAWGNKELLNVLGETRKMNIRLPSMDYIEKDMELSAMGEKNYCGPLSLSILLKEKPEKICKDLEKYGRKRGQYSSIGMVMRYLYDRGLVKKYVFDNKKMKERALKFMEEVNRKNRRIKKLDTSVIEKYPDIFKKYFSDRALIVVNIKGERHMIAFYNNKLDDIYLSKPKTVYYIIPLK